ncbi:MAG: hypothetical protein ACI9JT_002717, partial [Polaribacter sp.]
FRHPRLQNKKKWEFLAFLSNLLELQIYIKSKFWFLS